MTTYWGCESTVLRGSVESRFFPVLKTENLKINMAEADLLPKTFTSSSASDADYDISLNTSENENENIHTEASSDNCHQTQKAMQSLKSAGVRRCQSRSTGSSCHPVELIKLLKTTYKKWQPLCFRESEETKGINKN